MVEISQKKIIVKLILNSNSNYSKNLMIKFQFSCDIPLVKKRHTQQSAKIKNRKIRN